MLHNLGSGIFDSRNKYGDIEKFANRKVNVFEIDLYNHEGRMAYLNGNVYKIKKGAILVAKPGDIRNSILPVSCYYIHFESDDESIINLMSEISGFYEYCNYESLSKQFMELRELYVSNEKFAGLKQTAVIIDILYEIYALRKQSVRHSNPSVVDRAILFMNQWFGEKISVTDVAQFCNVSNSSLHKIFVKFFNDSPISYLIKIRVLNAQKLLAETELSLEVIAEKCGFFSVTYFCDCFKRNVGISPSKYRKTAGYKV